MPSARAYFTPLAVRKLALLTLLSVQIGFQPLLMGWYAREARGVGLRVGVIEGLKLIMGLIPLLVMGQLGRQLKNWDPHVALQTTAAPALIYVLQNYLNQAAVVVLDGVTFNILNQTKIIWTALLVYLLLRRYQSRQQIVALTILCAAAVLMTTGKTPTTTSTDKTATDAAFVTGAYQALIAAILSALAGTIIQRALQAQKRNAYVVTIELSILGELTILLWTMTTTDNGFFSKPRATSPLTDLPDADGPEEGLWAGWTIYTVFALFCQAAGGVLVGFVIKYCGNVEKSFAVVVGMIITALLEKQYNGKPFGVRGIVAIVMVATATIMYTMYPPTPPPAKGVSPERPLPLGVDDHLHTQPMVPNKKKKSSAPAVELEPFLRPTGEYKDRSGLDRIPDEAVDASVNEARRLVRSTPSVSCSASSVSTSASSITRVASVETMV